MSDEELTVAIVDDSPVIQRLTSKLIKKLFPELKQEIFPTGDAFLKAFKEGKSQPSLILLDILMPGTDGYSVCVEVRKEFSPAELPIIFITGQSTAEDVERGYEVGGNDYVPKPLSQNTIKVRVGLQLSQIYAKLALLRAQEKLSNRKRMESLGIFSRGVAHNFNNLLGTILGGAQLLPLLKKEEEISETVALIEDAVKQGNQLTRSLLVFSRPEDSSSLSNLSDVVSATFSLVKSSHPQNLELETDIPGDLPLLKIRNDSLAHVLGELFKNSFEACDSAGKLVVRAALEPGDNQQVAIFISDTGRGVPAHLRDTIFEPFRSSKGMFEELDISIGTLGLGLTSAYNILNAVDGSIQLVESSEEGSTFKLLIPCGQEQADA